MTKSDPDHSSSAAVIDLPTQIISSNSSSETDLNRTQPKDTPISLRRQNQAGFLHPRMENVALRSDEFSSVINLSHRQLSDSELSVLSRGLSFCPVPDYIDGQKLKI